MDAAEERRRARVGLSWVEALTPLGDAASTARRLNEGEIALRMAPVLGAEMGGERVPLALFSEMRETAPPRFWPEILRLLAEIPEENWGTPEYPVVVTSSNFGVGSTLAFSRNRTACELLPWASPQAITDRLREAAGWGPDVTVFSHACVSAQLGLEEAAGRVAEGARRALVFSFDGVSAFVAGGFHSLKILNGHMPAPFAERDVGAIGLGDGIAAAIVEPAGSAAWELSGWSTYNEMYHMTGNEPGGTGFERLLERCGDALKGRRPWILGHGTGTLEAGRLEARTLGRLVPEAPLVSWKGSLGHTLGSCALVELAVAVAAWESGKIPGTPGLQEGDLLMAPNVSRASFAAAPFDAALMLSNAFGGAHAGCILTHV